MVARGVGGAVAVLGGCAALLGAGCGPIVHPAPFPVRPDSVRPGDLLGPFDGKVIDAGTERPVSGALVAVAWAFERGIGAAGPVGSEEVVTQTGADGRYAIPRLPRLPTGLSTRVRRATLIVYRRGYVAWRSDRRFPGRDARRDFSQTGNLVRLEAWQPGFAHSRHLMFMGGGPELHKAAAWEAEQAALEMEGEVGRRAQLGLGSGAGPVGGLAGPFGRRTLDITGLLSDDEIRGSTGYVGAFEDRKLGDLPTTEFYDSRHFKAEGKPESFDVGLRVWRLGAAASEVQYQKLQQELPQARATDELGDNSFRARDGQIQGLVFFVRERGVVVSLTCGASQCVEPDQILKLGKLVESRLADLPPVPPASGLNDDAPEGAPQVPTPTPAPEPDAEPATSPGAKP
jgi:hypothetical protein